MVHKGGPNLGFSGDFVSHCGNGAPNCDSPTQWLTTEKVINFLND